MASGSEAGHRNVLGGVGKKLRNSCDFARSEFLEFGAQGGEKRQQVVDIVAWGGEDDDRDGERCGVLLIGNAVVHRQQGVEVGGGGEAQEFTVLGAAPFHVGHGDCLVALQMVTQVVRQIFVEEEFQAACPVVRNSSARSRTISI
jgi:hypothetical protein